jgi:hypothetical protein
MMRIPDAGRFEMRLADGAANPYLFPAVLLAAGMDGIENKLDPGKRVDLDMFSEGHKVRGARKLPLNLLDALRDLGRDKGLCAALGQQTGGAGAADGGRLHQAEDDRVECLHRPSEPVGARQHAGLLRGGNE